MKMPMLLLRLFATAALLWSVPSLAWDGEKSGKIVGIDVVTNAQNFGFRIYMDGTPMCQTSEAWAYVNKSADNYDALVSVLTTAYFNGKSVNIYTVKNGVYCEIGYVQLR